MRWVRSLSVSYFLCGVGEIRTREPLLATTRFPGVQLQLVFLCCLSICTFSVLKLQVSCKFFIRQAISKPKRIITNVTPSLHICNAKLVKFNHICKSFAHNLIFASKFSSSTSLSSSDSLKCGQDNTPIFSASRYTLLKRAARSFGETGSGSGRIVKRRQPQPGHSGVRRHHKSPVLNRQQSFMFEHIFLFV